MNNLVHLTGRGSDERERQRRSRDDLPPLEGSGPASELRGTAEKIAAVCGLVVVAGNIAGVAVLGDIPHAYQIDALPEWASEIAAHPQAAAASAWSFTLGLLAMLPFLLGWSRHVSTGGRGIAWMASSLIAAGALLNAAGTATTAAWAHSSTLVSADQAYPWLTLGVALDALFNLLFGGGIILLQLATWRAPRDNRPGGWLHVIGLAAGVASLPVAFQIVSADAAGFLFISGPLWLLWFAGASVHLWRLSNRHPDSKQTPSITNEVTHDSTRRNHHRAPEPG